jgi:hypothetical protein
MFASKNLVGAKEFRKYFKCDGRDITVRDVRYGDLPPESFHEGVVYRGVKFGRPLPEFTLPNLISLIDREGGLTSALHGLVAGRCGNMSPLSNMAGITPFHHTTTDIRVATRFAITESSGGVSVKEGAILVINLPPRVGLDVLKYSNSFTDEKEVAVPGFIYKDEILYIISIDTERVTSVTKVTDSDFDIDECVERINEYIVRDRFR